VHLKQKNKTSRALMCIYMQLQKTQYPIGHTLVDHEACLQRHQENIG